MNKNIFNINKPEPNAVQPPQVKGKRLSEGTNKNADITPNITGTKNPTLNPLKYL